MEKEILAEKAYSNHPGDAYLKIVLAKWRGEYVTWGYNSDTKSFFWGHYFKDLIEATEDYKKRGEAN